VTAKKQYTDLRSVAQNQDAFSAQREQFSALNQSLETQVQAANKVYEHATRTLTYQLLSLIQARKSQLQEQSVNTRLAMLRIQDLQQQGGE
jgi:septum formation inhibitor MinC